MHKAGQERYQISISGPEGGETVMHLSGRLDVYSATSLMAQFKRALGKGQVSTPLTVDMAGVNYLDSAGALALKLFQEDASAKGVAVQLSGVTKTSQQMLDLIQPAKVQEAPAGTARRRKNLIAGLGAATLRLVDDVKGTVAFLGELAMATMYVIRRPKSMRWGDVELYMELVGVNGLPIVGLIAFLLGLIMAFMSAIQLKNFGANIYVANLVALAMVRELGPIMSAVLVAGRSGSAFAAEIGTMMVNQEVDALEVMGLSPTVFLVLPKILATVLMLPLLILFADVTAIIGGLIIGVLYMDLTVYTYVQQTMSALAVSDIVTGAFKGVVFALLIAGIGCQRGFTVYGGAGAVGSATTQAVVAAMFMIVVADSIFAIVQYYF